MTDSRKTNIHPDALLCFLGEKNEDTLKFTVVFGRSFIHSISIHRLVMRNDYLSVGKI